MSERIYDKLGTILPVSGGATGALTQAHKFIEYLPSWKAVIGTIILTAIGGIIGYLIKLGMDKICKK